MLLVAAVLVCSLASQIRLSESTECYSCQDELLLLKCNTVVTCSAGQVCSYESKIVNGTKRYTLGCKDATNCPVTHVNSTLSPGAVVGRALWSRESLDGVGGASSNRSTDECSDCCSINNCNRQLCQFDPTCKDTVDYDCASVGSSINICADERHAKNTCKKFCGLCSITDGAWSDWSAWSVCSATCGTGAHFRLRSCSNPPPRDGGNGCVGSHIVGQNCSLQECPVNGAWSDWASYGPCSQSCDIGVQARGRKCNNPAPAFGGLQCKGDPEGFQLCYPGACADGGWSVWGSWGSCSRTCGDGLRSKSRSCNNPPRSIMGKECQGEASHFETCQNAPCIDDHVAFLAKDIGRIPTLTAIIFHTIQLNMGGGYDNRTGIFTAPVGGIYTFSAQLCPKNSAVLFQLVQDTKVIGGFYHGTGNGGCSSMTSSAVLKVGNKVWVESYFSGGDVFESDTTSWNMFSGTLVRKD